MNTYETHTLITPHGSSNRNMKRSWKIAIMIPLMCVFILATGLIEVWPPVFAWIMLTTSMEPDIKAGDMFMIDRTVPFHEVNVGDVAVYWQGYGRIAHGVVDRTDDKLFTEGNNLSWGKVDTVTGDKYIGIVGDVYEIVPLNVLLDHVHLDDLMQFPSNIVLMAIVALSCVFIVMTKHPRKRHPKKNASV